MNSVRKIIAFIAAVVLMAGFAPVSAFAAGSVELTVSGDPFIVQGGSSALDVQVAADPATSYKLLLESSGSGVSITNTSSGILSGNSRQTMAFTVERNAKTGYYTLTVKAVDPNNPATIYASRTWSIDVVEDMDSFSSQGKPAMDISYSIQGSDSLTAGQLNYVTFSLFNRSSVTMHNMRVTLTLPDGVRIESGPGTRNVGVFEIGKTVKVDYPLSISSDVKGGSIEFSVTASGVRGEDALEVTEKVYIPVTGGAGDDSKPVLIVSAFDAGGKVKVGSDFDAKFTFFNTGTRDIKNVRISVLDQEGAVVPKDSAQIFIESIAAGAKVDRSIKMTALSGKNAKNASLVVSMNYYDPSGNQLSNAENFSVILTDEDTSGNGGVTNPILMVSDYSFGGGSVLAGSEFPLNFTIRNTSGRTLRNIKVVVTDSSGTVIPAKGSNSLFISSIAAGASFSARMQMSANRMAEPMNDVLSVAMSYENSDGGTFSSTDTITIPIVQEDRLVVDDVLDPGWLTVGSAGYVSIKYYNMGKTTLSNLRVSVSGDFTIDGDSSQYVGNMNSGRSDYFSFNFFPEAEGECSGKAVFTYENSAGEEQVIEKEFTFNVGPAPEMPEFPDGEMPMDEQPGLPLAAKALIGAGALAALIVGVKLFKKHRKAKAEALELDE